MLEKPRYVNLLRTEACNDCPVIQEAIAALLLIQQSNPELVKLTPHIIECAPGKMKRFGLIEQPARTFAAFWRPSNFTEFTPQGEEIVEIDEGSVGELKIYGKNGNCPHNFGTIPTPSFV